MQRELIIVGVDPGTTLGYAIIGLDGRIIELNSSRMLDQRKLVKIIIDIGQPVIVAADKHPVPGFVAGLATKLGARIIGPKEDILVSEKKRLTKGLGSKNDHERDSLAAALLAYKRFRPLLDKIENYVEKEKKKKLEYYLKRILLTSESISIRGTAEFLESSAKEKQDIINKLVENRDFKRDYFKLLFDFQRLKKELNLVRDQRDELKREKKEPILKKYSSKKHQNQLKDKDKQIRGLYVKIKDQARQIKQNSIQYQQALDIIKHMPKYQPVRIIENLGIKYAKIAPRKDEILYVRDPSVGSHKTVSSLLGKVSIVLSSRKSRFLDDFIFINCKNLKIIEFGNIGVINRKEIHMALRDKNILKDIVRQYKKSR